MTEEEKTLHQETVGSDEMTEEATEETTEEAAEEMPEEEGAQEEASGKKERKLGWAKKAKEKASKADEEKEAQAKLLAEANDRYTRLFAEFDNYRKRTDKEKSAMFGMGAKDVLEKILPIVDSFERGLGLVEEEDKNDPFEVGMEKIYKQFLQVLESIGVTQIEAVGHEFDPNFHNAVMHVDDESVGENIIVEEFQKGYMYKDTLLRPSMVKVAN
ncbi:MAG: nucleotide exchange factor GrpE [Lachnospiraceae bacterium]|nr:nucleotide exchange factor GrpE [Lachnospiraceae bacterium]